MIYFLIVIILCAPCGVKPVMPSNPQDEKAVYDASCYGNIDTIRSLSGKGTNLNGYKDSVSKPVTFSLLILVRTRDTFHKITKSIDPVLIYMRF